LTSNPDLYRELLETSVNTASSYPIGEFNALPCDNYNVISSGNRDKHLIASIKEKRDEMLIGMLKEQSEAQTRFHILGLYLEAHGDRLGLKGWAKAAKPEAK
jgi:hypothetical protein